MAPSARPLAFRGEVGRLAEGGGCGGGEAEAKARGVGARVAEVVVVVGVCSAVGGGSGGAERGGGRRGGWRWWRGRCCCVLSRRELFPEVGKGAIDEGVNEGVGAGVEDGDGVWLGAARAMEDVGTGYVHEEVAVCAGGGERVGTPSLRAEDEGAYEIAEAGGLEGEILHLKGGGAAAEVAVGVDGGEDGEVDVEGERCDGVGCVDVCRRRRRGGCAGGEGGGGAEGGTDGARRSTEEDAAVCLSLVVTKSAAVGG